MKKLIVYGGAFNPPTPAHISAIRALSQMDGRLVLLPSGADFVRQWKPGQRVLPDLARLELLEKAALYQSHIDGILEQIAHMEGVALRITTCLKPVVVSGGGGGDKVGNAVARIVDDTNKMLVDVEKWRAAQRDIGAIIAKVQDKDEVDVLYKRYLHFKKWDQIADEMCCTERNAQIIHGKALASVNELLKGGYNGTPI